MELPEVIASEPLFRGRVFELRAERLRMPDGSEIRRETIYHPGAVCMVAVDADGSLLLVRQYRHAAGKPLLELPAGTLEPGEEPAATAVRELQEEVGMRPGRIQELGGFFVAPGYASEYIHMFVCTELQEGSLDGDEDEDIEVVRLSLNEVLAAIDSGDIVDAKTIVGVLRWLRSGAEGTA